MTKQKQPKRQSTKQLNYQTTNQPHETIKNNQIAQTNKRPNIQTTKQLNTQVTK